MRYLSQRYSMPYGEQKAVLTDIGTEELAHLEIVAAIVHQLTRNLTAEELEEQGFGPYYIDHATGIWPQAAGGVPFNACEFQSKGDPVDGSLRGPCRGTESPEHLRQHPSCRDRSRCREPIRFLRKREIVTSSASEKPSAVFRRSWTPETSTLSTQASIRCRLRQEIHGRRIEKEIPFLFHKIYGRKGSLFSSNIRPDYILHWKESQSVHSFFVGLSSSEHDFYRYSGKKIKA